MSSLPSLQLPGCVLFSFFPPSSFSPFGHFFFSFYAGPVGIESIPRLLLLVSLVLFLPFPKFLILSWFSVLSLLRAPFFSFLSTWVSFSFCALLLFKPERTSPTPFSPSFSYAFNLRVFLRPRFAFSPVFSNVGSTFLPPIFCVNVWNPGSLVR